MTADQMRKKLEALELEANKQEAKWRPHPLKIGHKPEREIAELYADMRRALRACIDLADEIESVLGDIRMERNVT